MKPYNNITRHYEKKIRNSTCLEEPVIFGAGLRLLERLSLGLGIGLFFLLCCLEIEMEFHSRNLEEPVQN